MAHPSRLPALTLAAVLVIGLGSTGPTTSAAAGTAVSIAAATATSAGVKALTGPKRPKKSSSIAAPLLLEAPATSVTAPLKVDVWVSKGSRTVQMQANQGGRWVTRSSAKADKHGKATLTVPSFAHKTKAKLRVYAPATATHKAARTKTVTLTYIDPRKLTSGLAGTVRSHIKSRCATASVAVTKDLGAAGLAHLAFNHIEVASGLSGKSRVKAVAYHECAHLVTFRAMNRAGVAYDDARRQLNKLFRTSGHKGFELLADAMANHWGSAPRYNGYGRTTFTKAQKAAAKKVLAGHWVR